MPFHPHPDTRTWATQQRLREEALIEAEALRHQAIDDLWRGASEVLATAGTATLRAGRRLAARLHRRARWAPEV